MPLRAISPNTPPDAARPLRGAAPFRLVRYFSIASVIAFAVVAAALFVHETRQGSFFEEVQGRQAAFFGDVQKGFVRQQDEAARRDLVATYESGNVTLTRMLSNTLWAKEFAPLVARSQQIPIDHCRALADETDKNGRAAPSAAKKACFAEVGARVMALAEFRAVDAKMFDVMRKSSVVKVKVFDLRGLTVYSSEARQVGEDKASNGGWKSAVAGKPASELTHRDKFSAFEGVIEDRDVISSYLPVLDPAAQQVVGVFEVYSDVTPLLAQIKATAGETARAARANMDKVDAEAAANARVMKDDSTLGMLVVFGMLAALFAVLYLVVRRAGRIIAAQASDRSHMQQQLGQSEKMSALGQMVAGVAHQLNTPLAFSHSNVSLVIERLASLETPLRVASRLTQLVRSTSGDSIVLNMGRSRDQVAAIEASPQDLETMGEMLRDVLGGIGQMSQLVQNMRDFTRLDRSTVAEVDVNQGLRTVLYMAKSVVPTRVQIVEDLGPLPPIVCNASQLNQVFLNLINNGVQAIEGLGTVTVSSRHEGEWIAIRIADTGSGIPAEVLPHIFEDFYTTKPAGEGTGLGLPIALEIARAHGGDIQVQTWVGKSTVFTVLLPVSQQGRLAEAA